MEKRNSFWKPQPGDVPERHRELRMVKAKLKRKRKGKRRESPGRTRTEPKDDRFYLSLEWRQLRYLAIKNCGGRCMACGASAEDGARIHVDHIKPRKTHPHLSLRLDNLQVLCEDCNIGKGGWDDTDWRIKMR